MNRAQKIIISLISLLIIATVIVAIKATSAGAVLVSLENKANTLESENQELKEKVVNSTSLTKVGVEADKLGFKKPENIIYLNLGNAALSAEAR